MLQLVYTLTVFSVTPSSFPPLFAIFRYYFPPFFVIVFATVLLLVGTFTRSVFIVDNNNKDKVPAGARGGPCDTISLPDV